MNESRVETSADVYGGTDMPAAQERQPAGMCRKGGFSAGISGVFEEYTEIYKQSTNMV